MRTLGKRTRSVESEDEMEEDALEDKGEAAERASKDCEGALECLAMMKHGKATRQG